MATAKLFFCLLLLLVYHEAQGITECGNATLMYGSKGEIFPHHCPVASSSKCYIFCYGGGVLEIECNNFGHWDEKDFRCLKACPRLDVMNANETTKTYDGEVGKTMEFVCHEGFVIKGHEKITCLLDYTWDHQAPSCESRRFADEVVKAMETHFFLMIGKNNTSQSVDLIILLDVSRHDQIRNTVDLVKSLLLRYKENQRSNFYTLITYADNGSIECTLCDIRRTIEVLNKVATRQHQPTTLSNLGSGLSRIFTQLLLSNSLSRDRDRILLLVTGRNPGISHNHQLWTKILREDVAFKMFVMALGDDVNKDELKLLVQQPWQDHFFHLNYSQIHEAVGNLTYNESVIVKNTCQLAQQMKGSMKSGNVSSLFMYMGALDSSELIMVKEEVKKMLQLLNQTGLKVALNVNNGLDFKSVKNANDTVHGLQAGELQNLTTLNKLLVQYARDNKNLHILFISSSGSINETNIINDLKDMGSEIYAVGVVEQPGMKDLVSYPWYQHIALASKATVECDG